VEGGLEAATIQAIAERSGVHASAIYRRWSSRNEIIEQAVFSGFAQILVKPGGDLRRDLRRFVRAYLTMFDSPAARAAMPGLLASYQAGGRSGAPEEWLVVSARPQFIDILEAAGPGSIDGDVDPEDVFDMLLGALIARTLVPTVAARRRSADVLVDLTLKLLQPASVSDQT
jgi:AcrR family transcriptional regulator